MKRLLPLRRTPDLERRANQPVGYLEEEEDDDDEGLGDLDAYAERFYAWLREQAPFMKVCHLLDRTGEEALCGTTTAPGVYVRRVRNPGVSPCEHCGKPRCEECAVVQSAADVMRLDLLSDDSS